MKRHTYATSAIHARSQPHSGTGRGREQNRFRDRGVDTVRTKVAARSSRSIALSGGNHKSLGAKLAQEQAGLHAALKLSVPWTACGRLVKHLHT